MRDIRGIRVRRHALKELKMNINNIVEILKRHHILLDSGLSEDEIIKIENTFNLKLPPDLRELLQIVLPISNGFVNWRDCTGTEKSVNSIFERLNWPLEGILFDIEHNSFWYDGWGVKPIDINEAKDLCKIRYLEVPTLIPIYSHRYISAYPLEYGNPIFSVHQTDIIYYGENLEEYFKVEFNDKSHSEMKYEKIKQIKFWADIVG
ncbi:SMI1/KNR4 family protein [Paenibacillus chibensis]|uniref:SMI1/KNR4 family protein n=1 Tax=Paenibacillus chibensis TaxID=59846 RepID=A0ABU6PR89_9BACL|nr:SMI1/KNR4 family protein [Paenibacillus chibensis]